MKGPKYTYEDNRMLWTDGDGSMRNIETGELEMINFEGEIYTPEGEHLGFEAEDGASIIWDDGNISLEF